MTDWVPIDNKPEAPDCYIIAWLPSGVKREECFYAISYYDPFEDKWDFDGMERTMKFWKKTTEDIEVYAWTELPDPYKQGG